LRKGRTETLTAHPDGQVTQNLPQLFLSLVWSRISDFWLADCHIL